MRFVLLYAALVGLPLLGILAILRAGQNLTPPRAVAGVWKIESSLSAPQAGACLAAWNESDRPQMVVSQSGPHLQVILQGHSDLLMRGSIQGDTVILTAMEAPDLPDVPARVLRVDAILDDSPAPRRLVGWLNSGCGPQAEFIASWIPAEEGGP